MSQAQRLQPWIFFSQYEPYKRILCAVISNEHVSLAISNHYLSLAEPVGTLWIRENKFPVRSLQRLVGDKYQDIWGCVLSVEDDRSVPGLDEQFIQNYIHLSNQTQNTKFTYYVPQNGLQISTRILDSENNMLTNKGMLYLQNYLDEMGPLNTFG
eukprot:TRINITY_DN17565_c0_g2_i2.p2 TRINITY_DN17565_c0_g2~~TRINITY_DN17565_c0_g2_i2.p2  ORF type:complete len:155 (+),score=7.09 TRINITY_DN17565_c0_g2_i2:185-649(+)